MRSILVLLCMMVITGCGTLQELICEDYIDPDLGAKEVRIDREILESCQPLLKLTGTSPEELLILHGENSKIFNTCKSKQETSIKTIRKLANIPEVK